MELRQCPRAVHDLREALVNLKLGVSMSEDAVWAESLLVFFEVFQYLEEAVDRNEAAQGEGILGRTEVLKDALTHFYGQKGQKEYVIQRPVVEAYLKHLKLLRG